MLLRILFCYISLLPLFSHAGDWENRRSLLERSYKMGDFRIFYSLSGQDALPVERRVDNDLSGTPDFIEHISQRLMQADRFFTQEVQLIAPLESKRYKNKARFIDVNVIDFSKRKSGPRNGIAYDGTPFFDRTLSNSRSSNVLTIDLSRDVRLTSQSVEHELFHLYQNGYTFFKNRWYTEGTARWAELIMLGRVGAGAPPPNSSSTRDRLFNKSYNAKSFWNELIRRVDSSTQGKRFIKALLEELDASDDVAAQKRGLDNNHWKESEQRRNDNNIYIWNATLKAIQGTGKTLDAETRRLYKI